MGVHGVFRLVAGQSHQYHLVPSIVTFNWQFTISKVIYKMELQNLDVNLIVELAEVVAERAAMLETALLRFGDAMNELQRNFPPHFAIRYNMEGDGHGAVQNSM